MSPKAVHLESDIPDLEVIRLGPCTGVGATLRDQRCSPLVYRNTYDGIDRAGDAFLALRPLP